MTTIYFIRHSETDHNVKDDRLRPLTPLGQKNCSLVTEFLADKGVDAVLSSPYKRCVDTLADFAEKFGFEIETYEDLRERAVGTWVEDFASYAAMMWADFEYKLPGGECLREVQARNIKALKEILAKYSGKTLVIGTHGTALSTIINYFDKNYGYDEFMAMVYLTPWVAKITFDGEYVYDMQKINLLPHEPLENIFLNPLTCKVDIAPLNTFGAYKYTVIFARYKNKWMYTRAKAREGFETAGGFIELGETPLEGARRELYEETGAEKFEIVPLFDYAVSVPTSFSNGQVFLAEVEHLGEMPDFEMAEIALFDTIPDNMRFPYILPILFKEVSKHIHELHSKKK